VVGTQRLAVHLVGDQNLRRGIGRPGKGQSADEGQVVPAGLRQDRTEVVRAVVGAFEADVDAVRGRPRLRQHVVQERASPARGGDRVVAPRLSRGQGPHCETPVAGAFEGDRPLDLRHGAQIIEGQPQRVLHGTADIQDAVVLRDREVAPDVVEPTRGDLTGQGLRRSLGVVGGRIDHLECCASQFEIVHQCHVRASSSANVLSSFPQVRSRGRRKSAHGPR
jgi:hypothetical protein